jgi:hypothetical protein
VLADPDKPLLFTMARLDRIKNITGLVDWYGRSAELRERGQPAGRRRLPSTRTLRRRRRARADRADARA